MLIRCTEQVYNFPFRSCIFWGKNHLQHLCIYSIYIFVLAVFLFLSLIANIDKYLKSVMFFLNKKGINFTLKKC